MKIKTCLLAALMGITSSFSIVLAIETPKGWQSGGGAEPGEVRYVPEDAGERGVILIISGLRANEENLPLTQYLEKMADKIIYDNPPGTGVAILQRDKAKQKGDRAELSLKISLMGSPVNFYLTAYPADKHYIRTITFFVEDDAALQQRYQKTAHEIIEAQYAEDMTSQK